ncbi:3-oxoacyl-[acyl-carrier-protein] reductase [Nocardia sp. NPDC059177]|uniref:3-oxoacyl-[acyl-carrier-protein] reductase n=1 Tax=Nocardia sp. NPDC059177 TaxID=3346759 RepID=UPI0036D02FA3
MREGTPRIALITGGARGIGAAVANRMAEEGYDIAFCYRGNGQAAEETADKIASYGVRVHHAVCDVSDEKQVDSFVSAVESELGSIDVLVNSAGIVRDRAMVLMDPEEWDAVIATNLRGTFLTCRRVAYTMIKRSSGSIVNVSSVIGIDGNISQANYAAAKAGINAMSRTLAKELARYDVRVNVVAPGWIATDMTAALPEKARKKVMDSIAMGRAGTAEEVADAIVFLAGDRARYITGETLRVDGGIVL